MRRSDRVFCPGCGWAADRDHNASLNIPRGSGWNRPWSPWSSALHPLSTGKAGLWSVKPCR